MKMAITILHCSLLLYAKSSAVIVRSSLSFRTSSALATKQLPAEPAAEPAAASRPSRRATGTTSKAAASAQARVQSFRQEQRASRSLDEARRICEVLLRTLHTLLLLR